LDGAIPSRYEPVADLTADGHPVVPPPPPAPVPTPWHPPAGLLTHARAPYLYTLHTCTPLPHMVTPPRTGCVGRTLP